MSNDLPVLTLKRKPVARTDNATVQPVVGRKKVIVVSKAAKHRETPAPPPSCVKTSPASSAKSQDENASKTAKRDPMKPRWRPPRLLPLQEATAILSTFWPALIVDGKCRLLKVRIDRDMKEDIDARQLKISKKKLRSVLRMVTQDEDYRMRIVAGALRYDVEGNRAGYVTPEEALQAQSNP
ncbi:ProQ/FINO family protein [Klebsiella aerogenes]|uniref:ProQ/FINO family protein n=1 Tax=Klebsiella aerogenes TaxID=548 RepID=UPI000DA11F37|nr:ProQ/FINO family protein [Klebsiella aerogenes]HCB2860304.1 hypothetical protein [Klebsiella aerogenes]HCB2865478.1 hypothetical protein [Klebsiella aerogenes]HCB2881645.1 hypothetical protein [Klebsiella aerogenes]HCB3346302.1 hypothetical protein [Klebsiella aerogenes]HCM1812372.1 hypothetical protein [Klebsiella aerogenes]